MNVGIAEAPPDPNAPRPSLIPGEDEPMPLGGLRDLAVRTGGLAFANRNDIPECVRQAADDQLGYYLLGYSPREGTFEKSADKAKFHRIVVRLRRRGLQVRWKSGFQGVPDQLLMTGATPPEQTRERQLLEALASPFHAAGLKVRLTSIFYETKADGPFVHSMLQFDAKDLSFVHEPLGDWHASVDVVTLAYRGYKQTLVQRQSVKEIRLTDEQYQEAMKSGFLYLLDDKVMEPGAFLIRAVVRDRSSERIGSASQVLQVPDTRKNRFAMTGITIRLASPEILKNVGLPAAPPGGTVEAWSEGGPAVRRYLPGQNIMYAFGVINPKLQGSPKEPKLTYQVRLFRNGKLFFSGDVKPLTNEGMRDPQHFVDGGVLRLGTALTPGEYLMQVVVTDLLAGKKNAQTSQWIDFEVTSPVNKIAGPATPSRSGAPPN